MKKGIRNILLIFFLGVFLFSGWQIFQIVGKYQEGTDSYDALNQYVSYEETSTVPAAPTEEAAYVETTEPPDVSAWPQVDFDELAQINPDVVGWIYIEGTNINYPIVQGQDNEEYLNRLFDGSYHTVGCIFLDYRCDSDFSGNNSIIYGHHMKNKSMFAGLVDYKKQAFYDEHPVGLLVTPDAYLEILFFSGYVSDNRGSAWDLNLDDEEYAAWLAEIQEKSCFESSSIPTPEDSVITLSTCTYEFSNAKFVLHGYVSKRIEKAAVQ